MRIFSHCRRSRLSQFATAQQQQHNTTQQHNRLRAQNVSFQKFLKNQKNSEHATLLSKFDKLSKLLRRVGSRRGPDGGPYGAFEMLVFNRIGGRTGSGWGPDGVFEMLVFNRLGGRTGSARRSGRGPRNVSFQSDQRADGVRMGCGRGVRNVSFQ